MIKVLGTLRGVSLKSKVGDDNRTTHQIALQLELTEGVERVQDMVEQIKQIVSLEMVSKQPTLIGKGN